MSSSTSADEKKAIEEKAIEQFYGKIKLDKELFIGFLKKHMEILPQPYCAQESHKITLVYFLLASLDALNAIDTVLSKEQKQNIIDYVYGLQIIDKENEANNGWRGSYFFGFKPDPECKGEEKIHQHDKIHIAMTYVALCILCILGDDFSRVNRKGVIGSLKHLQQKNGSFSPITGRSENDMRFVYCAMAISYFLDDWSGVDIDLVCKYVHASQSYEYAFGQGPGQESHGGSTYCAIAALWLCGRLEQEIAPTKQKLIQWCCERQVAGFQGRSNKPADTCYSFWIGATLKLLGAHQLIETPQSRNFSFCCQSKYGGFGKSPDAHPDVLHTYYGLAGLSIAGAPDPVDPIHCGLAITQRCAAHLSSEKKR
eukprot:CAMPEP_0201554452 /NCGR_PEP_ID=MMETSP0173_2-20130828/41101_1 /ASSEMBLY_ACC=CAM_ASM_000268 /TAXON_ID=218659 /ORGANISM="Vexillifera sp., Strain DIVA3 564/2" /LENGTH=368 /DNA_ID=CAMNT_0047965731 /DNA_START=32 /DNA_END=1134 /DNA_ORIENTATION=-